MDFKADSNIRINVASHYIAEQSDPDANKYLFTYTVTIENTSPIAARLIRRHWIITDANEHRQEVTGEGVVGQQPYLKPGQSFKYTSAAMLQTPVGYMHGFYQMQKDNGDLFDAAIPAFNLSVPNTLH